MSKPTRPNNKNKFESINSSLMVWELKGFFITSDHFCPKTNFKSGRWVEIFGGSKYKHS